MSWQGHDSMSCSREFAMIRTYRQTAANLFVLLGLGVSVLGGCAVAGSGPGGNRTESETAAVGWQGDTLGRPHPADVARGRQIAERECASCHAIDSRSASPKAGAPPLRDVLGLYEADNLAYRFIEGMRVGHDDMPLFDFDVRTADTLIAYIGAISGSSD
jgi:cytochrome c